MLAAVLALAWAFANMELAELTPIRAMVFLGGPLIVAAALIGGLFTPFAIRALVSVCITFSAVGAYGAQAFLQNQRSEEIERGKQQVAAKIGVKYDPRSMLDVVYDRRAAGDDVFPNILSHFESPIGEAGQTVVPLSGISNAQTVFCNERGYYETYRSDRLGLNNPDDVWNLRPIDIAVIGDSFVHGYCLPEKQALVGQIRQRFPATINLGLGSRGPLIELAALVEFAKPVKPRVVLWVYTECNDIQNLNYEASTPILRRYLADAEFTQNLFSRQDDVDKALHAHFRETFAQRFGMPRFRLARWLDFALLRSLRDRLDLRLRGRQPLLETRERLRTTLPLFKKVLNEARGRVESWGGQLIFVYLPSYYRSQGIDRRCLEMRDDVLETASGLRIPIIDLVSNFSKSQSPADNVWYFHGSHLSVTGYRIAAEGILEYLENQPSLTDLRRNTL